MSGNFSVTEAITGGLPVEKAIEYRTVKEQKTYDEKAAKVTAETQKRAAMIEAQDLTRNVRETVNFTSVLSNIFDNTSFKATTNGAGDASDYISVTTNNESYIGYGTQIEVKQVAAGFSARIGDGNGLGLDETPNLSGTLLMTINGQERTSVFDSSMDINAVLQEIKDSIQDDDNCIVRLDVQESIGGLPAEYYIVIESKVTGSDTTISFNTDNLIGSFENPGDKAGRDAVISYISGGETVEKTSKTNENIDIGGLNVTAYTANKAGEYQTIVVTPDHEMIEKTLAAFILSYNNLSNFIAKQQEVSTEDDAPATLKGSNTLQDLIDLHNKILITINNNDNIKSIFDIGLELIDIAEGRIIDLKDQQKFTDAITNHYDDVKEFFSNTAKVTDDVGNQGSKLRFVQIDKTIKTSMYGKDITVSLSMDADGKVSGVKAVLDEKEYVGEYKEFSAGGSGNVTFPNTDLDGVTLLFSPKNTVNTTERFTVNLSQGLAGAMYLAATDLYNEAQDGRLQADLEASSNKLGVLEKDAAKAEAKLNDRQAEIQQMIQLWTMQQQMFLMQMKQWDAIGASTAPAA